MIIAKSDNIPIEIHETKYGGYKTLRLRSVGGSDREIDLARLKLKGEESVLAYFGITLTLPLEPANRYYENIKSSYLKTFGLKGVGEQ